MSPCGQHPRPGRFQTEAECGTGLPILSPSTVLWHVWEVAAVGRGGREQGLGPCGAGCIRGCRQEGSACSGKFENEEGEGELVRYCSRGLHTGLTLEQTAIVNSGFHDGGGVCGRTPQGHVCPVHPHSADRVPPASGHGPFRPNSSQARVLLGSGFLNLLLLSTSHHSLSGPTVSSRPAWVSLPLRVRAMAPRPSPASAGPVEADPAKEACPCGGQLPLRAHPCVPPRLLAPLAALSTF